MKPEFEEDQKGRKIVVIGATGFIGYALASRLIGMGFRKIVCVYRDENRKERLFSGLDVSSVTFLCCDLAVEIALKDALRDADVIINASGVASDWGRRREIWKINVEAPEKIVKMIGDLNSRSHYIHLTSATVYGFSSGPKTEESALVESDRFYTAGKVEIHEWLRGEMSRSHSFPITVLAPTIVWGPGDRIYVPEFRKRMRSGCLFYPGKDREVSFVHIDDLVDAVLLCFFNEKACNQEFIIDGAGRFSMGEYIRRVAEFSELPPPGFGIPAWLCFALAWIWEGVAGAINRFRPDYRPMITVLQVLLLTKPMNVSIAKARERLGYDPGVTFSEGCAGLRDYCRMAD